MPYITFIRKRQEAAYHNILQNVVLGRSLHCDIILPDVFVSREHCRIELQEQGWVLVDLNSKNGIYFQGRPIRQRILEVGDVFEIGTIAIRFEGQNHPELEGQSTNEPFGHGPELLELFDTVYAKEVRPALFAKPERRKAIAKRLARNTAPLDITWDDREEAALEWTELDVELQIARTEIYTLPASQAQEARDGEWTELDIEFGVADAATASAPTSAPDLLPASELAQPDPSDLETFAAASAAPLPLMPDRRVSPTSLWELATGSPPPAAPTSNPASPKTAAPRKPATPAKSPSKAARSQVSQSSSVGAFVRAIFAFPRTLDWAGVYHYLRQRSTGEMLAEVRGLAATKPRLVWSLGIGILITALGTGLYEVKKPEYHIPAGANLNDPRNFTD